MQSPRSVTSVARRTIAQQEEAARRLSTASAQFYRERQRERQQARSPELTLQPAIDANSKRMAERGRQTVWPLSFSDVTDVD